MLFDILNYILSRSQEFSVALGQHLNLTFISLLVSIVAGLLLGILATRVQRLRNALLTLGNLGRTVPSMAVLALALPFLGIGTAPTLVALVFIGALPILVNTTVGIEGVDPSIKEAARGMGMSDLQVLLRVELPISIAVIMAGIRTAAVVIVASATLASFIGGGGLGDLILQGHVLARDDIMLAGAIPATLLAFYLEEMFGRLEKFSTPRGLKPVTGPAQETWGELLSLLAIALALPVIFGVLLPWDTVVDAGGAAQVSSGLHPGFRAIGVPALLLGLLAALWPVRPAATDSPLALLPTTGAALVAILWFIIQSALTLPELISGAGPQAGFLIQAASLAGLTAVTLGEAALRRKVHPLSSAGAQAASA